MAYFDGHDLILNEDESIEFNRQLIHPDVEVVSRREEFFKKLDAMPIIENDDGSFTIEINLQERNNGN